MFGRTPAFFSWVQKNKAVSLKRGTVNWAKVRKGKNILYRTGKYVRVLYENRMVIVLASYTCIQEGFRRVYSVLFLYAGFLFAGKRGETYENI